MAKIILNSPITTDRYGLHFVKGEAHTDNEYLINRLIRTKFYIGQYRGIDLKSINRTENEVKDSFHLELMKVDEFIESVNVLSDNPRKKYFDRENQEVVKVLKKIKN